MGPMKTELEPSPAQHSVYMLKPAKILRIAKHMKRSLRQHESKHSPTWFLAASFSCWSSPEAHAQDAAEGVHNAPVSLQ